MKLITLTVVIMLIITGCSSKKAVFAKNQSVISGAMTKVAANTQLQAAMGVQNAGAVGTTLYNMIAKDSGLPQSQIAILNLFSNGGNLAKEMEKFGVCQVNPGAHKLTNVLMKDQSWGSRSSFYRVTMNGGSLTCITQGDNIAFNVNGSASHYKYCGNKITTAKIIKERGRITFAQVLAVANIKIGTPALNWWEQAGLKIIPTTSVGVQYRINPDTTEINLSNDSSSDSSSTASSSSKSSSSSSSRATGGKASAQGGQGGNANITNPTDQGCSGANCSEQPNVDSNYGGPDASSETPSTNGGPDF